MSLKKSEVASHPKVSQNQGLLISSPAPKRAEKINIVMKSEVVKTVVKPTSKKTSNDELKENDTKGDVDARIEALRARALKSSLTSSQDLTTQPVKKPPSVEKIKIEAPLKDPEPCRRETEEPKPVSYRDGRSRGHKRTLSISESMRSVSNSKKDANPKQRSPKEQSRPGNKSQPPSKADYEEALNKSGKLLDSEKAAEQLKNKAKIAEAHATRRKARERSRKKSAQNKNFVKKPQKTRK